MVYVSVLPGVVEVTPSLLLVMARSGAAFSVSVSALASLLLGSAPLASSSLIVAVLTMLATPAGAGLMTCKINVAEPVALLARAPTVKVNVPALSVQPGFSVATNDVPVGKGSAKATLVASWSPALA